MRLDDNVCVASLVSLIVIACPALTVSTQRMRQIGHTNHDAWTISRRHHKHLHASSLTGETYAFHGAHLCALLA